MKEQLERLKAFLYHEPKCGATGSSEPSEWTDADASMGCTCGLAAALHAAFQAAAQDGSPAPAKEPTFDQG